jgi:predicted dinucleotide-binding enzyme
MVRFHFPGISRAAITWHGKRQGKTRMKVAIIGAGNVGGALGRAWSRAGHAVVFGVRDPGTAEVRALVAETGAEAMAPAGAAAAGEVVVLALPWGAAEAAVRGLGDLAGKVVIDCMNPLAMGPDGLGLDRGHTTSGAETLAAWLPGARVVKTLNQVGAEVMADASGFAHPPVMFAAGDDVAAKAVALGLVRDLGFEALDAGALRQARLLEPFGMVWINQALLRGHGRNWAFAALPRKA